jgi:hypothetical protein
MYLLIEKLGREVGGGESEYTRVDGSGLEISKCQ